MTVTPDDLRPGLKPPQFGLGAMLGAVAMLGVIFATIGYVGSYGALPLILFVLAVIAHVAGGAIGTRLRENGDRPIPKDDQRPLQEAPFRKVLKADFAPATRLRERTRLGKSTIIATCAGTLLGGTAGGYGLALLAAEQATLTTVTFGVFACGVLGGIWSFAAASLVQVAWGAIGQALRESRVEG